MNGACRFPILSTAVDAVSASAVLQWLDEIQSTECKRKYILATNPEKAVALAKNDDLRAFVNAADVLIPDGVGVALAVMALHGKRLRRLTGADLMIRLCEHASERGYRVFLFGSHEEVNRSAADILSRRYPELAIAGRRDGYVTEEAMPEVVEQINTSQADILFVGLGSPKQEAWLARHLPELDVTVCQGVGGTFDTIAGTVPRAPVLLQRFGLEWLYRLARQPSRISRQKVLPLFCLLVARSAAARLVRR